MRCSNGRRAINTYEINAVLLLSVDVSFPTSVSNRLRLFCFYRIIYLSHFPPVSLVSSCFFSKMCYIALRFKYSTRLLLSRLAPGSLLLTLAGSGSSISRALSSYPLVSSQNFACRTCYDHECIRVEAGAKLLIFLLIICSPE